MVYEQVSKYVHEHDESATEAYVKHVNWLVKRKNDKFRCKISRKKEVYQQHEKVASEIV